MGAERLGGRWARSSLFPGLLEGLHACGGGMEVPTQGRVAR